MPKPLGYNLRNSTNQVIRCKNNRTMFTKLMATYNLRCIASLKPTRLSACSQRQVTPWLGKPFIISASADRAVGLSWFVGTATCKQNQRGKHRQRGSWSSIRQQLAFSVICNWTGRIPLKLEIFPISKNEWPFTYLRIYPGGRCCTGHLSSLARPPSPKIYASLVAGPLQSKHSAIDSLSTNIKNAIMPSSFWLTKLWTRAFDLSHPILSNSEFVPSFKSYESAMVKKNNMCL